MGRVRRQVDRAKTRAGGKVKDVVLANLQKLSGVQAGSDSRRAPASRPVPRRQRRPGAKVRRVPLGLRRSSGRTATLLRRRARLHAALHRDLRRARPADRRRSPASGDCRAAPLVSAAAARLRGALSLHAGAGAAGVVLLRAAGAHRSSRSRRRWRRRSASRSTAARSIPRSCAAASSPPIIGQIEAARALGMRRHADPAPHRLAAGVQAHGAAAHEPVDHAAEEHFAAVGPRRARPALPRARSSLTKRIARSSSTPASPSPTSWCCCR